MNILKEVNHMINIKKPPSLGVDLWERPLHSVWYTKDYFQNLCLSMPIKKSGG